ncbi:unnamed protein product [Closterium sp. Yama58-4]|nr:unnamed protein product [Closterium sp. Yama58-4]
MLPQTHTAYNHRVTPVCSSSCIVSPSPRRSADTSPFITSTAERDCTWEPTPSISASASAADKGSPTGSSSAISISWRRSHAPSRLAINCAWPIVHAARGTRLSDTAAPPQLHSRCAYATGAQAVASQPPARGEPQRQDGTTDPTQCGHQGGVGRGSTATGAQWTPLPPPLSPLLLPPPSLGGRVDWLEVPVEEAQLPGAAPPQAARPARQSPAPLAAGTQEPLQSGGRATPPGPRGEEVAPPLVVLAAQEGVAEAGTHGDAEGTAGTLPAHERRLGAHSRADQRAAADADEDPEEGAADQPWVLQGPSVCPVRRYARRQRQKEGAGDAVAQRQPDGVDALVALLADGEVVAASSGLCTDY